MTSLLLPLLPLPFVVVVAVVDVVVAVVDVVSTVVGVIAVGRCVIVVDVL